MALEDRPCKNNVKEGDFLVSDYFNTSVLLKINKIYDEGVFAEGIYFEGIRFAVQYRSFKDSVILNRDGKRYLVGENAIEITKKDSDCFLVVDNSCNKSILLPITRDYDGKFVEEKGTPKCCCIEDAVILNRDGTCLVGEKVIRSD